MMPKKFAHVSLTNVLTDILSPKLLSAVTFGVLAITVHSDESNTLTYDELPPSTPAFAGNRYLSILYAT